MISTEAPTAQAVVHELRATLKQALLWLEHGARVSAIVDGKRLTLLSRFGPLLRYESAAGRGWTTRRRLRARLTDVQEWEVTLPEESLGTIASEPGAPPITPLVRTLRLLRLESRDLGVIIVYGVTVGFLSLSVPIAAQSLVNTVAFGTLLQPILVLSLLLGLALVGVAALRAFQMQIIESLQRRLFARVVEHLATNIPRVVPEVWDARHGPELMNRFFDLFTIQKSAAALLLDGMDAILVSLVGLTVLAFYHPTLLAFDAGLILAAIVVFGPVGHGGIKTAVYESKSKYAVAGWLEEMTRHPLSFRQGRGSEYARDRARQLAQGYLDHRDRHFRIVFRQVLCALFLQVMASCLLLGLGGFLVIRRQLTIGQLVAAELIVSAVVASFAKLGSKIETYYDLVAGVDKIGELIDLPIEEQRVDANLADASSGGLRTEGLVIEGFVSRSSAGVLDLHVQPGKIVRVENLSDLEAARLSNILFGFVKLTSGSIRLGGHDLRDLTLDTLRKRLALVRRPELLHGSILDNLRVGAPALARADAYRCLEAVAFPTNVMDVDGLDTDLFAPARRPAPTHGVQLAIARAIALGPEVIVIDRCLDTVPRDDRERILRAMAKHSDVGVLVLGTSAELTSLRPMVGERAP